MNLDCKFETERLVVEDWQNQNEDVSAKLKFAQEVIRILTPNVTKSLPDGWQNIKSLDQVNNWIFDRANESTFLTVNLRSNKRLIGFIFLFETESENKMTDIRFGYLLSETFWGKGIGTELVDGLVDWCRTNENIKSLSGGVENDNIGSIKVVEKTGFSLSKDSSPSDKVLFYEMLFDRDN